MSTLEISKDLNEVGRWTMSLVPMKSAKSDHSPHSDGKNSIDARKARVLYVEDDDLNWRVTEFSLRDRFLIDRARNASEAFEFLGAHKYNIILMDIELKGSVLNGIEIARVLKGIEEKPTSLPSLPSELAVEQIPIVFVTAYTARYDLPALRTSGADDMIAKPVDFTRLMLVMSRLLVRPTE